MGKKEQSSDDEFMSIKESSSWTERERERTYLHVGWRLVSSG